MLKNYESRSPLPNIFAEIEKTLATHGARQIIRGYDRQGQISDISFIVETVRGPMAVKMPSDVESVKKVFDKQGIRYKPDQPYRTAWATMRDWVAVQMALVDLQQAKIEQVFLPYAMDKMGNSFFSLFESGKLALPSAE